MRIFFVALILCFAILCSGCILFPNGIPGVWEPENETTNITPSQPPPLQPNVTPPTNATPLQNNTNQTGSEMNNTFWEGGIEINGNESNGNDTIGINESAGEGNETSANESEGGIYWGDSGNLEILFFDVGHGDATLVRTGEFTMLIDAGPTDMAGNLTNMLKEAGVEEIDVLVISTWAPEKIGGVKTIFKRFSVHEVWRSEEVPMGWVYEDTEDYIERQEVMVKNLKAGEVVEKGVLEIEIFNPQEKESENYPEANSIVMRLNYGEFCVVLPAYLEHKMEALVMDGIGHKECPVFKWRSHGDARPEPSVLFDRVNPDDVIISVGQNDEELPDPTTLSRLSIARVGVWRTDLDKNIYINATEFGEYVISGNADTIAIGNWYLTGRN
ncbi:MAG: MBL fold metallo-hydrolase [Candidatus Micrarchaeota archaeon]